MALLKLGSTGAEVLTLKNLLIAKGYKIQLSNQFDAATETSVKDFQVKNQLLDKQGKPDGIVGPLTMAKLKEGNPTQESPAPPSERPLDKVSLDRIKKAHPKLRDELLKIFTEINNVLSGRDICRLAYTLRTFSEQNKLYAQGRTVPGSVVTRAKGGQSYHNYGLAVDIVLLKDANGDGTFESASWETNVDFDGDGKADWMEVVGIFEKHGWAWGGKFKSIVDKPHFEKTFGKSVDQLLSLYNSHRTDSEGYVLL